MKLFVYEHVTGGGMTGEAIPSGLAHEADLMLRALVRDLADLPGVTCFTVRDPRFAPVPGVDILTPRPGESSLDLFRRGVAGAEWVWPTAPERGGILEQLARVVLEAGRGLLGSRPDAIRLAASKHATARHLDRLGIPVVPTRTAGEAAHLAQDGMWVVKPDDGAGAEDTVVLDGLASARALLDARGPHAVLQPWLEGVPASVSLLCAGGGARLLACNRQHIRLESGRVHLAGITVNGARALAPDLAPLADRIAAAIPGLRGYVGVDLLLTDTGPIVLEINPRLTTSWCGLGQALGHNPAHWIVALARTGTLPDTPSPLDGGSVELSLEPAGAR